MTFSLLFSSLCVGGVVLFLGFGGLITSGGNFLVCSGQEDVGED